MAKSDKAKLNMSIYAGLCFNFRSNKIVNITTILPFKTKRKYSLLVNGFKITFKNWLDKNIYTYCAKKHS